MSQCEWAILCDYSFLDAGRKMCLIGIFDRVFAARVPSGLHQSSLAMKASGDPNSTVTFRIEIVRPMGGQLASFEATIQIPETGSAEVQMNIAGLPLPDYGSYAFNVYEQNELLKIVTFLVVPPPSATPASES